MNNLMEKMCNALRDAKICAAGAIFSFKHNLAEFAEICEIKTRVESICGKDVALCFDEDAGRIAKQRCAKYVDTYRELADECIKMSLEGKPKDEIIWYFTKLER